MKLSKLGEFGLIDRLSRRIKVNPGRVKVGMGDDAAVIKTEGGKLLIVTTDTLVQGIHFDLKYFNFWQLGWKALAVNISDIAAMGGYPTQALVTLGLPKKIKVESIDELYKGVQRLAKRYKIDIIGGDTIASPDRVVISITLLGQVEENRFLVRSKAKVGDYILVTGDLGASAAGLHLLKNQKSKIKNQKYKNLLNKHLIPEPRVKEAKIIADSGWATSLIDNSDGLSRSIIEICRLSKVGARIWLEALPILKETKVAASKVGRSEMDLVLYGGEDYELVFTTPWEKAIQLADRVRRKTGTLVTVVGKIVNRRKGIKLVDIKGKELPLKHGGYEHFKK